MNLDEIKTLLKSGDVAGAETAAQELLAAEPDNVQAMMLYGTCRQLQGDEATFRRIHDELAPKMEAVTDDEMSRLWRKYSKECLDTSLPRLRMSESYAKAGAVLKEYVILGGIVVIALGVAAYLFGKNLMSQFSVSSLYAGPKYYELKAEREAIQRIQDGPERRRRIREYESTHGDGAFDRPIGAEKVEMLRK